ncbi:MAG: PLP-dependent transferase [Prevotella sp.]|nr:PLP-dependent transferase [Bacteroides sp.]MCM1366930.1 PLP-dependent transferase [Prevotella sp.]MCM1437461.1 PLP-dependent transferase [Prevotella sp.]
MEIRTKALAGDYQKRDAYNALSMPVYHCAAFEFDDATSMSDAFCGRTDDPDYSRVTNPTVIYYEKKVKELSGAETVSAFTSGMAAISATLTALSAQGKNIVSSRHLFANTYSLLSDTLPRFGVEGRLCDLTNLAEVERNIDEYTCCIFLEIITNPQMEIADLKGLSELAHKWGIPLVADTTMIPFTHFRANNLGVDVEVISSTKYLSGGATSLGGLVLIYPSCGNLPCGAEFSRRLKKEILFNYGGYMTPHAAYMQTLGLETLDARYARHIENTQYLAERLGDVPGIERVTYPGLKTNPYHIMSLKQFGNTAGAMLTIDLASREACFDFLNKLKVFRRATNLFDNKSLAIHPASTIFGNLTAEEREAMDVPETTIRLSIGLEDAEDLLEDIKQALK